MTAESVFGPWPQLDAPYLYLELAEGEQVTLRIGSVEVGGMFLPPGQLGRFARPEGVRFHAAPDTLIQLGPYVDLPGAKVAAFWAPLAGGVLIRPIRVAVTRNPGVEPPGYSFTLDPRMLP